MRRGEVPFCGRRHSRGTWLSRDTEDAKGGGRVDGILRQRAGACLYVVLSGNRRWSIAVGALFAEQLVGVPSARTVLFQAPGLTPGTGACRTRRGTDLNYRASAKLSVVVWHLVVLRCAEPSLWFAAEASNAGSERPGARDAWGKQSQTLRHRRSAKTAGRLRTLRSLVDAERRGRKQLISG